MPENGPYEPRWSCGHWIEWIDYGSTRQWRMRGLWVSFTPRGLVVWFRHVRLWPRPFRRWAYPSDTDHA